MSRSAVAWSPDTFDPEELAVDEPDEAVTFEGLLEEGERGTRQRAYRQRAVERLKADRKRRLKQLERESGAIAKATTAYRVLDAGDVPTIRLHNEFIRLDPPRPGPPEDPDEEPRKLTRAEQQARLQRDLATRPPLTRLVYRSSNALPLYLTAVYVAHLTTKPGSTFNNTRENVGQVGRQPSWATLAAMTSPKTNDGWFARLRRALEELEKAGLVSSRAPFIQGRFKQWSLLSDTGRGTAYRVPGESTYGAAALPAAFFLNGWHLVLTPPEIAMLLVVMEMSRQQGIKPEDPDSLAGPGAALSLRVRRDWYGLSPEVYETGQQLYEFGVLGWRDPMPHRRRGKLSPDRPDPRPVAPRADSADQGRRAPEREPYQYYPPHSNAFDEPAVDVVTHCLRTFDAPYRLHQLAGIMTPGQLLGKV